MKLLAIKIDIDTQKGYRVGVPALLDLFDSEGVRATFCFSMGPENLPSFLARLRKDNLITIISSAPGIIRDVDKRGHDCALHAWNPQEWKQNLDKLPVTTLEATLRKAVASYVERIGRAPQGFSAPGWKVSDMSLRIENELNLSYCSDCIGFYPFYPKLGRKLFNTLQIPTTLPPLEFVRKENPLQSGEQLAESLITSLAPGLNVLSIDAEVEGIGQLSFIKSLLALSKSNGVGILSLQAVADSLKGSSIPVCSLEMRETGFYPHEIAVQGAPLREEEDDTTKSNHH